MSPERFRITDNCGGIAVDLAKNYAFRFGRPAAAAPTPNSIGQFGVGMKRTIFKLGSHFRITSTTSESRFVVDEDVTIWTKKPEWTFEFADLDRRPQTGDFGTDVEVTALHSSVAENFGLQNFANGLLQEISTAHVVALERGLAISINGTPVGKRHLTMRWSQELQPACVEIDIHKSDQGKVTLKLIAGLGDRTIQEGGWYVFCNGRLVLEADQTETTGWGDGGSVPQYHADYAFFRGYAFFDSANASLLPWTTTKTGVDTDSPIYRGARLQMIKLMRQVINFLRRLEEERAKSEREDGSETPLRKAFDKAQSLAYADLSPREDFLAPSAPIASKSKPTTRRIQYDRPIGDVDKVKAALQATSLREVGEMTFDYYLARECS
jgi:hypothetical protein